MADCELDGGDGDADGHRRSECGGDDCDDTDGNRYPDNAETCDAAGHDEDCDESTFGTLDADGDGFISGACCNGGSCGDDCDDSRGDVHAGATERCNEVDDDCDGLIDEEIPLVTCWPDGDGDGWGRDSGSVTACACPAGYVTENGDCHDAHTEVHPNADFHGTSFSMPPTFYESWDYDCDGVEELRWTDGSMLGCQGTAPSCRLDEGWTSMPARVGCGLPADVVECRSDCSTRVVTRPQECR